MLLRLPVLPLLPRQWQSVAYVHDFDGCGERRRGVHDCERDDGVAVLQHAAVSRRLRRGVGLVGHVLDDVWHRQSVVHVCTHD